MFEIYKTNVEKQEQAIVLLALLHVQIPIAEINFDLEDCDRILRVKGERFCSPHIKQILKDNGFECTELQ